MKISLNTTTILILIVAAILLFWVVFRGCSNNKQVQLQKREFDSLMIVIKKAEEQSIKDSILYTKKVEAYQSNVDSLKTTNTIQSSILDKQTKKIAVLIAKGAVAKTDTIEYVKNCDSISKEAAVLIETVSNFQNANDILQKAIDSLLLAKELQLKQRNNLISDLRMNIAAMGNNYNSIYAINTSLAKKNKRERTLSRILGATTLIAGIFYLTK